ncbi:hypothetical protein ACNQUF_12570, partial [Corynebacterium diphtheriae]
MDGRGRARQRRDRARAVHGRAGDLARSLREMAFVAHSLGNRHLPAQFFDADGPSAGTHGGAVRPHRRGLPARPRRAPRAAGTRHGR